MNSREQPESLDSQMRELLDKDSIKETEQPFTVDPAIQAQERFELWLAHLKRRYPLESEEKLRRAAAEYACLNRKERRRAFKLSSPKLPRYMRIPKRRR